MEVPKLPIKQYHTSKLEGDHMGDEPYDLPGGKMTKRTKVVKLSLAGTSHQILGQVSTTLFGRAGPANRPARFHGAWKTTDELLYNKAKMSYDGIIAPFLKSPRVYKFESVKEKIWADRKIQEENNRSKGGAGKRPPRLTPAEKKKQEALAKLLKSKQAIENNKNEEESQTDMETFLDPFAPIAPWKKEVDKLTKKVTYINTDTYDRQDWLPSEFSTWNEKIGFLEKLTPREDLDGYEYKENEDEKRSRLRIQVDFEKKMKIEIERREHNPTDLEQVEDVLYNIMDAVCKIQENSDRLAERLAKKVVRDKWNFVTRGYKMKELTRLEDEEGELTYAVSDLDVLDMIVTPTGHVLSIQTPPMFFENHEKEREYIREQERLRLEKIDIERRKPLKDNMKIAFAMARNNPKLASIKAGLAIQDKMDYLLQEKLIKKVKDYPRRLRALDHALMAQNALRGLKGLLKTAKNPKQAMMTTYKNLHEKLFPKSAEELAMEALLSKYSDEAQGIVKVAEVGEVGETEDEKKLRLWKETHPNKYTHADSVLITMTLLLNPPPLYIKRPPYTWKDSVNAADEAITKVKEGVKNNNILSILPAIATDTLKIPDVQIAKAKRKLDRDIKISRKLALKPITSGLESLEELQKELANSEELSILGGIGGMIKDSTKALVSDFKNSSLIKDIFHTDKPPPVIKDIFDDSLRKEWELKLRQQIADAICLPVKNIVLEEVRRFNPGDKKIIDLRNRRESILKELENEEKAAAFIKYKDGLRRKALIEGRYLEWEQSQLDEADKLKNKIINEEIIVKEIIKIPPLPDAVAIEEQRLYELELQRRYEVREDRLDYYDEEIVDLIDYISEKVEERELERIGILKVVTTRLDHIIVNIEKKNELEIIRLSKTSEEDKEQVIECIAVVDDIIEEIQFRFLKREYKKRLHVYKKEVRRIHEAANPDGDDGSLGTYDSSHYTSLMSMETDDEGNSLLIPSIIEEKVSDEQIRATKPTRAGVPKYFKIGVINPDEAKKDPSYWMAKELEALNIEEKRRKRIKRLQISIIETGLQVKLRELQELKDDIVYHANEFIQPAVDLIIKPTLEFMTPIIINTLIPAYKRMQKELVNKSMSCLKRLGLSSIEDNALSSKSLAELLRIELERRRVLREERLLWYDQEIVDLMDDMCAEIDEREDQRLFRLNTYEEEIVNLMEEMYVTVGHRDLLYNHRVTEYDEEIVWLLDDMCVEVDDRKMLFHSRMLNYKHEVVECLEDMLDEVVELNVTNRNPITLEQIINNEIYYEVGLSLNTLVDQVIEYTEWNDAIYVEVDERIQELLTEVEEDYAIWEVEQNIERLKAEKRIRKDLRRSRKQYDSDGDSIPMDDDPEFDDLSDDTEEDEPEESQEGEEGDEEDGDNEEGDDDDEEGDDDDDDDEEGDANEEGDDNEGSEESDGKNFIKVDNKGRSKLKPLEVGSDNAFYFVDTRTQEELDEAETELLKELAFIRDQQYALDPEMEVFYEKQRDKRLTSYPPEIVYLLEKMCISIELASTHIKKTGYEDGFEEEKQQEVEEIDEVDLPEDGNEDKYLIGCEVSFMIFISDDVKQRDPLLQDLEAEDVAVMLRDQTYNKFSVLNSGSLTKNTLDVKYKVAYKKDLFHTWEQYWIHILHPVFFGYSTKKPIKSHKDKSGGRLESGLMICNPVDEFDARSKDTYLILTNKYKPKRNAAPSSNLDPQQAKRAAARLARKKESGPSVVDLGKVDEFAVSEVGLKVFRPNMGKLTFKDVERCRRIYTTFSEIYEREMKKGLVDGIGLKPIQFSSLKDMQTSFRIFKSARQKFQRDASDDGKEPIMYETTKITDEVFGGWIQEVRNEEEKKMFDTRANNIIVKELRQQENEVRRLYNSRKYEMLKTLVEVSADPQGIGEGMQVELKYKEELDLKVKGGNLPKVELHQEQEKLKEFKMLMIEEEKNSRELYRIIIAWIFRYEEKMEEINYKKQLQLENGEIVEEKEVNEDDDENNQDNDGVIVIKMKKLKLKPMTYGDDNQPQLHIKHLKRFFQVVKMSILVIEYNLKEETRIKKELEAEKAEKARLAELEYIQSMMKGNANFGSVGKQVKVVNALEVIEEILPPPPPVPFELEILKEEIELARSLKWLYLVNNYSEFYTCFFTFSTLTPNIYVRDELIQFAQLTAAISPIYRKVQDHLTKIKDDALIAAGLKLKGKQKKRSVYYSASEIPEKQEPMSEEMINAMKIAAELKANSNGLNDEAAARAQRFVDSLHRKAKREVAWKTAHPHKFINIPGEAVFCPICRERNYEIWLTSVIDKEKIWKKRFNDWLMDYLEYHQPIIYDNIVFDKWAEEENKNAAYKKFPSEVYNIVDTLVTSVESRVYSKYNMTIPKRNIDYRLNQILPVIPKRGLYPPKQDEELIEEANFLALDNGMLPAPESLVLSGLSLIDVNGESIMPKPEAEESEEEKALRKAKERVDIQTFDNDIVDEEGKFPRGIKIRVWNTINGLRSQYLGYIEFDYEMVVNPPSGMRTYELLVEEDQIQHNLPSIKIKGTITVKLKVSKYSKQKDENGKTIKGVEPIPVKWKFEIVRLNKITVVDRKDKTSAYCEIFWRGTVEKDDYLIEEKKWVLVGITAIKEYTMDPIFLPDQDGSVLTLPPVWVDEIPIPGRGAMRGDLNTGGYVAENAIPKEDDEIDEETLKKRKAKFKNRRKGKKEPNEDFLISLGGVMESSAAAQDAQRKLNEEATLRLEMTRTLMIEQEKERTIMSKEDIAVRQFEIDTESLRAAPYLLLQIEKAREFSRLLQLIVEPPIILSRLIFLMGFDFEGGLRVMCQDPANYRMLDVIALPILYPEDEDYVKEELIKLIGKQHRNLVKVVDFSIHQVRGFTYTGYKAVNERSAIIVMEKYDGPNVMEYLQENWEETKNDDFRTMLLQIVNGIRGCHEEGIVHRNFHEDSVVVELPPGTRVVAGGISSVAGAPVGPVQKWGTIKFNCRLGEYWITQNPRRAGCQYSMGRSDWGNRCCPPETYGGYKVSEASDMYAFGICVYQWATGGRKLPNLTTMHVDNLEAHIPLKWGTWVFSLLRMCLQQNPKHRAQSLEVYRFLSNRKICMGLKNTHY